MACGCPRRLGWGDGFWLARARACRTGNWTLRDTAAPRLTFALLHLALNLVDDEVGEQRRRLPKRLPASAPTEPGSTQPSGYLACLRVEPYRLARDLPTTSPGAFQPIMAWS